MGKKPIIVTLTKGRHKSQPWTFSIDSPGPGPQITVNERYTRKHSAMKGALRKLKAHPWWPNAFHDAVCYQTDKGREVVFVTKPSKR